MNRGEVARCSGCDSLVGVRPAWREDNEETGVCEVENLSRCRGRSWRQVILKLLRSLTVLSMYLCFYYRPCGKPLLVFEKRNFVISLVSMQGQIAAETRNSEIHQIYFGFLCGGKK